MKNSWETNLNKLKDKKNCSDERQVEESRDWLEIQSPQNTSKKNFRQNLLLNILNIYLFQRKVGFCCLYRNENPVIYPLV